MNWFKRKYKLEGNDQPRADQAREAKIGNLSATNLADGCDSLPTSFGPFGSVTNPIPVNGINGEIIYINRLRTRSGVGFFFHRLGSIGEPLNHISPKPVDAFELYSLDGTVCKTVWFAPYHKWRSTLAPDGCVLKPYPTDEGEQLIVQTAGYGLTSRVTNFPLGLPQALEQSKQLSNHWGSSFMGQFLAESVRSALSKIPNLPNRKWAQGPIDFGAQESPDGDLVFLLDKNGVPHDTGIINHGASLDAVREVSAASNIRGEQALLIYALLDEGLLAPSERKSLTKYFKLETDANPHFACHFAWHWLWYELLGRPRTDGTYGQVTGDLVTTHWADLDRPEVLLAREVCDIMEAVAARRA